MLPGGGPHRGERRGDLQCCITRRVYCSRVIHYKKKNRYFLEGRGRRGDDNAAFCYADRTLRQDGGERAPRSNLCPDPEGWEEGTKDKGRHRRDLWQHSQSGSSQPSPRIFIPARQPFPRRLRFTIAGRPNRKQKRRVRSAPNPQTLTKTRLFSASSRLQLMPINH